MMYVKADDWQPSPGIRIEGKALEIVKSEKSMSVLAGPGTGKTELLAQRATFLLSTGLCPPPRRILAIAFKVDAAQNLKHRVAERCDPIQAQRFESLTLDAFAKRIVDQFLEAIPKHLRPTPDYAIIFPNNDTWEEFRLKNVDKCPEIKDKKDDKLYEIVHRSAPDFQLETADLEEKIQCLWWQERIGRRPDGTRINENRSGLTFDMIKSLATYILQNQPTVLSALRQTYSHVFMDEFQDVTKRQYELIKIAFSESDAVLTAVGDSNQAIMRWAGAIKDIFVWFSSDFKAPTERLLFNFRSNTRIVKLINDLAATFDVDYVPTECARENAPVPQNAVERWIFKTRDDEGKHLASFIADELQKNSTLNPSDFVILARSRVDKIESRIKALFHAKNLMIRNEARSVGGIAIQNLVKDKAYLFLLASVKLAVSVRTGQPFQECRNTIADVRGIDLNSDRGQSDSLHFVRMLVDHLKDLINGKNPQEVSGAEITRLVLEHIELSELQRTYREYIGGELLDSAIAGFEAFFDECRENIANWYDCISNMEGDNSIRLMTIHKSKGLEYHTVFFLELNDDAFFGNDSDINEFFVALSRARERVYFSFTEDSRGFKNVKNFYEKLKAADVLFARKP